MDPYFTGAPLETVEEEESKLELRSHHRRAFSDFPFDLAGSFDDDDMLFDPSDFINTDFTFPTPPPSPRLPDIVEAVVGSDETGRLDGSGTSSGMLVPLARSLTVKSNDLIGATDGGEGSGGKKKAKRRHRHSFSIDGSSTSMSFQGVPSHLIKRAMPPDQLAELERVDPVRARRIVANRESAARSKERKNRYVSEMEKKLQDLQMQSANLSQRLLILKKDTADLTTLQEQLKTNLQNMGQQSQIQFDLDQTIKEELNFLRKQTLQNAAVIANHSSDGVGMHQVPNPPPQLQTSQQPPQLFPLPPPPPLPPSGQDFSGHFGYRGYLQSQELAGNSNGK